MRILTIVRIHVHMSILQRSQEEVAVDDGSHLNPLLSHTPETSSLMGVSAVGKYKPQPQDGSGGSGSTYVALNKRDDEDA